MKNKKTVLIISLILVVGVGAFILGNNLNKEKTQELETIVESIFQAPPEVISNVSGIVQDIRGATIYLEINNPENYLPTDEVEKLTKYVTVSDETEINILSFNENLGDIESVEAEFEDIQLRDEISVISNENIRENDKFSATSVEVINY
ncbi:MAG: hypothetical protein WD607_10325 [Candidatus Paceibacterota bacterium]